MIYLSICIPTYNRSGYLHDTLESIISQPEFTETGEVEIVISDNCSTDDTETIVSEYLKRYPTRIRYNKNTENILDWNYEKVLGLGSGLMLKLNNDTLILNPNSLGRLLEVVKYSLKNNLTPFFLNGRIPKFKKQLVYIDKGTFISEISFFCTWIAGFCISKKSFSKIVDFSKEAPLMLAQVDVLMQLFETGHEFLVVPEEISTPVNPTNKGGYNLTEVFLTNYFKILSKYMVRKKELAVLKKEKKKVLYKFVLPYLINLNIDSFNKTSLFDFDKSVYRESVKNEFSYLNYLYFEFFLMLKISWTFSKLSIKALLNYCMKS
jgi:abequosyltransferase